MAYTPKTWVCGEPITDVGLNNMEEGIQEALQRGYECTETETVFFNDSITTVNQGGMNMGTFTPSQPISGNTLTVTMNGTEYELPKEDLGGGQVYYGEFSGSAPVFTNYPCFVAPQGDSGLFATENAGTYTVEMSGFAESITTTECFRKAVKSSVETLEHILDGEDDGSLRSSTSTLEGNGYTLGYGAVSLGVDTKASGYISYAEGYGSIASGDHSHAEGYGSIASGDHSHAEGSETTASGGESHAEGYGTTASGDFSHSEGAAINAGGYASHAEGDGTTASGDRSHAEGGSTRASGEFSHAEGGNNTTASGDYSHAEGNGATASGYYSHAQNEYTIAQGRSQTVIGKYNVAQGTNNSIATDYALIIGNGTGANNRSNAFAIKWDGTFVFADGTEITPAQFAALKASL